MTTELSEGGDVTLPREVMEAIDAYAYALRDLGQYVERGEHRNATEQRRELSVLRAALERAILAYGQRVTPEVLADFWVREFVDAKVGLCALCANTGSIITNAVSAAGVRTNYNGPCICPNGRALSASPAPKDEIADEQSAALWLKPGADSKPPFAIGSDLKEQPNG